MSLPNTSTQKTMLGAAAADLPFGSTTTVIDGATVTSTPVTLPGGGSGTLISVAVVPAGAGASVGAAGVADIPLLAVGGVTELGVGLPPGVGLTALVGDGVQASGALAQLDGTIANLGFGGADKADLTQAAHDYLALRSSSDTVYIASAAAYGAAGGTAVSASHSAAMLFLDTGGLASGDAVQLSGLGFIGLSGAARVSLVASNTTLVGDSSDGQFDISVGSGASGSSKIMAGGGNDTLNVAGLAALALPAGGVVAGAIGQPVSGTLLLNGGTGNDTVSFAKAQSAYLVQQLDGYVLVTDRIDPTLHMTLTNIENLKFSDATVAVQDRAELGTIDGMYLSILGRQADAAGLNFWGTLQSQGMTLGTIALDIMNSVEGSSHGLAANGDATHDVTTLYQALFGRAPDPAGLAFWLDHMQHGLTLAQVANDFATSAEMVGHQVAAVNWNLS